MTDNEALKWLKDMLKCFDLPQEQYQTALKIAIKALEHEQALGEAFNIAFLYGKEKGMEAIDKALYQMGMDGIKEQEIKALEQEPMILKVNEKQLEELKKLIHDNPLCVAMAEPKTGHCEDCISRKDLLKKCVYAPIAPVIKGDSVHYENIVFAKDIINAEPIQQEQKTEPCEDCISRQAAIDAIRRIGMCKCSTNEIEAIDACRRAVEALPFFTAEPKTDRIEYGNDGNPYRLSISNGKEYEQEPKTDVLDKIRAEIAEFEERIAELPNMAAAYATVRHCLDIIDKYRKRGMI